MRFYDLPSFHALSFGTLTSGPVLLNECRGTPVASHHLFSTIPLDNDARVRQFYSQRFCLFSPGSRYPTTTS
jgi:hypothetical protein